MQIVTFSLYIYDLFLYFNQQLITNTNLSHIQAMTRLLDILPILLGLHLLVAITSPSLALHEDQRGKFDWHKRFIGIPKFVFHNLNDKNIIVGTESNVIASLSTRDGSILWRQLLPSKCELNHMSVFKSSLDDQDYLIRTSCKSSETRENVQHIWNPQNGLLASDLRFKDVTEGDQAESLLADAGHLVDKAKAFTISDDQTILVTQDGVVSLKLDGKTVWSRDESMATTVAVEIVQLPVGMRDKFGMKKTIVLVTQVGKIFGLDTITGAIVWQAFDKNLVSASGEPKSSLVILSQSDDDTSIPKAIIIHPTGYVLEFNPISGQTITNTNLSTKIRQFAQTEYYQGENSRAVLLVGEDDTVSVFPRELTEKVKQDINKYYITIAGTSEPMLVGYNFILDSDKIRANQIWKFSTGDSGKVVSLKIKRVDEEVHSPARVLGDRGTLYKYINPNLIAIMTESNSGNECNPDHNINIYLVDGVTGALVHSVHHPKSRAPAQMVHAENWLVYSYYHTKNRRTEISSLELFEGDMQSNSTAFSSLARSSIRPKLIEHKSFIFPGGIDAVVDTVTMHAMTNKHLIVALPSGALLEIPRIFLDPRRPLSMLMEHREEGLIPYMPELPIPSESIVNYDKSLLQVRGIITSPASLESTSLVFAYGLDFFFTRVTPSKTFDILKDDFDHLLITAVLTFLVVASYVCKLLASRKALRAAW